MDESIMEWQGYCNALGEASREEWKCPKCGRVVATDPVRTHNPPRCYHRGA